MQFTIIARDGTDADALQRRMNARAAHMQNIEDHRSQMLMGAATLDDQGNMNGSILLAEFPSREALDEWLKAEPYVTQGVWTDVTVLPCKVAPTFLK